MEVALLASLGTVCNNYMVIYLLNLLDLVFTLYALPLGCTELNPLMQSVPMMVAYKVIGVGVLCWWLSHRPEQVARIGLLICTAVYGLLSVYHVVGLILIGGDLIC